MPGDGYSLLRRVPLLCAHPGGVRGADRLRGPDRGLPEALAPAAGGNSAERSFEAGGPGGTARGVGPWQRPGEAGMLGVGCKDAKISPRGGAPQGRAKSSGKVEIIHTPNIINFVFVYLNNPDNNYLFQHQAP
jgi:hypothetical protein